MNKFKSILSMTMAVFCFTVVNAQSTKKIKPGKIAVYTVYQCPMKCEGDKTYAIAGKCPKCGMNLKAKVQPVTAVQYQCPMKCEGNKTYAKPGKCPQCGMNLKSLPAKKIATAENNMQTDMASIKTEIFKVWGNCGMCKKTIEASLKTDGIATANWDRTTKVISVSYNPEKITIDDIQKKIAAVGYDTEKYRGDDKAYNNLPGCCQYERKN